MKSPRQALSVWISSDLLALIKGVAGNYPPREFIRNALYEAVGARRDGLSPAHVINHLKEVHETTKAITKQLALHKASIEEHEHAANNDTIEQALSVMAVRQEQSLKLLMQVTVTLEDTYAEVLADHSPPLTPSDRRDAMSEKYRQLKDRLNAEIAQLQADERERGAAE
ncbi:hypothetical protein [Zavarzinia aquatilis]|uniref:Uncharacterized protein n=1 Tax=Zavarzinia aquatilis TaxID=2211142 RepID=A0A317DVE0_9PROT|nr:hypothetical protein [Zavarzinia aquatilis]PWR17940.1 hypothetical protein DKG74_20255 [Zavarzinia aquatilis]